MELCTGFSKRLSVERVGFEGLLVELKWDAIVKRVHAISEKGKDLARCFD